MEQAPPSPISPVRGHKRRPAQKRTLDLSGPSVEDVTGAISEGAEDAVAELEESAATASTDDEGDTAKVD